MKLSVNAIYFALKEVFPQTNLVKRTKQDNDLSLACPYFHKGTVTLRPSQIYVVTQEQLDGGYNLDGHCLVILPELAGKPSMRKNLSVITVNVRGGNSRLRRRSLCIRPFGGKGGGGVCWHLFWGGALCGCKGCTAQRKRW